MFIFELYCNEKYYELYSTDGRPIYATTKILALDSGIDHVLLYYHKPTTKFLFTASRVTTLSLSRFYRNLISAS